MDKPLRADRCGYTYRTLAFRPETFVLLKDWQRALEQEAGRHLTNAEVLDRLLSTMPPPPGATA